MHPLRTSQIKSTSRARQFDDLRQIVLQRMLYNYLNALFSLKSFFFLFSVMALVAQFHSTFTKGTLLKINGREIRYV